MSGGIFSAIRYGARPVAVALVLGLMMWSTGQASTILLLDDTWADGSRTETNLPDESAVWVSHANTTTEPDRVVVAPGSLKYKVSAASTTRLHTYFALPGDAADLGVGDKLVATIDFITSENLINSTSRNFRVGLFSQVNDTHVTVDGASDAGGTGNPWASAQGYATFMFLTTSPGTTQLFQIGKRTNIGAGNLMGSTGDYTQATSGGGVAAVSANTPYSLKIELARMSQDQMDVSFTLSGSNGVLATQTVTDHLDGSLSQLGAGAPYTRFDMLGFRFSGTGAGTGQDITFTRFHVEHNVIPEPTSALLLGCGGVALMLVRRRGF